MHSTAVKVACAIILLVALGGWAVSVAGLAKLTDMCRKGDDDFMNALRTTRITDSDGTTASYPPIISVSAMTTNNDAYDCGMQFSLYWWIVALEFFVIVFALLASFFATFHKRFSVYFALGVATTLYCLYANYAIIPAYRYQADLDSSDKVGQSFKAATAGCIAVLVCNFLFGLVFGMDERDVMVNYDNAKPVVA